LSPRTTHHQHNTITSSGPESSGQKHHAAGIDRESLTDWLGLRDVLNPDGRTRMMLFDGADCSN
jgi:hypothetical protein